MLKWIQTEHPGAQSEHIALGVSDRTADLCRTLSDEKKMYREVVLHTRGGEQRRQQSNGLQRLSQELDEEELLVCGLGLE